MFFMGPAKHISKREHKRMLREFAPRPVVPLPDYSEEQKILIRTRHLLAEHWTVGSRAQTPQGTTTNVFAPNAVNFCLVGGLQRFAGVQGSSAQARFELEQTLGSVRALESLEAWNDRHLTNHAVLKLLDRTIARLERDRLARHTDVYSGC